MRSSLTSFVSEPAHVLRLRRADSAWDCELGGYRPARSGDSVPPPCWVYRHPDPLFSTPTPYGCLRFATAFPLLGGTFHRKSSSQDGDLARSCGSRHSRFEWAPAYIFMTAALRKHSPPLRCCLSRDKPVETVFQSDTVHEAQRCRSLDGPASSSGLQSAAPFQVTHNDHRNPSQLGRHSFGRRQARER